jgi:catechol 2,3-dioxygenase-like lactoylglutathione lyase family enzyme
MQLVLKRIILFTSDMARMTTFYRDALGLPLCTDQAGYKEFDAGGSRIALHNGNARVGTRPPKLSFQVDDVAAAREELIAHGAKLGKVLGGNILTRCEGKDSDGNPFQLSNRP